MLLLGVHLRCQLIGTQPQHELDLSMAEDLAVLPPLLWCLLQAGWLETESYRP